MYTVLIDEKNQEAFRPLIDSRLYPDLTAPDTVALGAVEDDGEASGVLLGRVLAGWLDISWLYIRPESRDRSQATFLLLYLLASVRQEPTLAGICAEYPDNRDNQAFSNLLRRLGFTVEWTEKALYSFTVAHLSQNAFWQRERNTAAVIPLGQASKQQLNGFLSKALRDRHLSGDQPAPLLPPTNWAEFHPTLSVAYLQEGQIGGILLCREEEEGLELSYVHVLPGITPALPLMLYKTGQTALRSYPPDTVIKLGVINTSSIALVEKLFPDLTQADFIRATLWTAGAAASA